MNVKARHLGAEVATLALDTDPGNISFVPGELENERCSLVTIRKCNSMATTTEI